MRVLSELRAKPDASHRARAGQQLKALLTGDTARLAAFLLS